MLLLALALANDEVPFTECILTISLVDEFNVEWWMDPPSDFNVVHGKKVMPALIDRCQNTELMLLLISAILVFIVLTAT